MTPSRSTDSIHISPKCRQCDNPSRERIGDATREQRKTSVCVGRGGGSSSRKHDRSNKGEYMPARTAVCVGAIRAVDARLLTATMTATTGSLVA